MEQLTVFTPTFNRKEQLKDLYESLKGQTDMTFRWLIVDDGSSDGTGQLVGQWIAERVIDIGYVYQENQGKCMALKKGIALCDTPWFICVDSDDTLAPDAVRLMKKDLAQKDGGCLGYIYPQRIGERESSKWVPDSVRYINIMDAKHLYGIDETAILFRTEYLKRIDIPQFGNEKFLSEEIIYIRLADYGMFAPRKTVFYLSQYQPGGLTNRLFHHWVKNPRGTVCLLQSRYTYCGRYTLIRRITARVKCILNLNALCMACGLRIFTNTPSKLYSVLLYIPSLLWRKIRFV